MGDAVRWGDRNKVDSWDKCCEQCLNFVPDAGKPKCNGENAAYMICQVFQNRHAWQFESADLSGLLE